MRKIKGMWQYQGIMKGNIDKDIIPHLIDTITAELTFIDENDRIVFWSEPETKIFSRPDNILGIDIRKCHSKKSQDDLEELLADMRSGSIDKKANITENNGRNILVEYIAVRDSDGKYKGCLEVCRVLDE